jgi:hypothetical protein
MHFTSFSIFQNCLNQNKTGLARGGFPLEDTGLVMGHMEAVGS